ncbi:GNAT family N-acetyltransferase [Leptolyngbya sp. AN03gr2]|uniref:GNAT family N-acetyltransferase n=1 Tax=unclassified Leptolyngbya TaxID=2650499 RepID=UPI003D3235E7
MSTDLIFAEVKHLPQIKALADRHRKELSFTERSILEQAVRHQEILIHPHGFLRFHHRRDSISTLHQICVDPQHRRQGIGKQLIEQWEQLARKQGIRLLRLKCPIHLSANGFYARSGFYRANIESGKRHSLVIWQRNILAVTPDRPSFIASLTASPSEIESLIQLWNSSADTRFPFEQIIYSPIQCSSATSTYLRSQKDNPNNGISTIWLDSGAYQVQQGKINYAELLEFISNFYPKNAWADHFVLPDIVPLSSDQPSDVEYKVQQTLYHCEQFFTKMPEQIQQRAVGPVQGRTLKQIHQCVETYSRLGIERIGFGSWGTCGPNGSINTLSRQSLALFKEVHALAREHHMTLHCFGIGGPNSLAQLIKNQTIPHSLDSSSFWKAAGFGNVFMPHHPQIHITVRRGVATTQVGFEELKRSTGHSCRFCEDITLLRNSRNYRVLHNLSAWLDSLQVCHTDPNPLAHQPAAG